ncbi:hypothetical protein [Planosporangium flavigriseum]|uniref:hypothetical protein n=1 Tax=Planosporangium flavigriseum TaxID=373681 RepID=UPI0040328859
MAATAATLDPRDQPELGHDLRDGAVGNLPVMLTQLDVDARFSRRNRASSARSSSDSCPAAASPRCSRSFFTQLARVPSLIPRSRDLRDRLAGLAHDPHRALAELRIEPPSRFSHEPLSLKFRPPRYEGNHMLPPYFWSKRAHVGHRVCVT